MSIPSCTLCRVPRTDDHIASGWHKFNQNLFESGRMPIAEANYNLYEKQRIEGVSHNAEEEKLRLEGNKRNVNQWHWEESDYTAWAKAVLTKGIKKINIDVPEGGSIRITSVSKFAGDAIVNMRKGRTFGTYDFDISVDIQAKVNSFDQKGSCVIPEISSNNKDDIEITNVKIEGNDCAERTAALKAFRSGFVPAVTKVVEAFDEQLQALVKDPSSYQPPRDDDSSDSESSDEEDTKFKVADDTTVKTEEAKPESAIESAAAASSE